MLNKKLTCKHAAMFGLDARIALAIFGALSVISGAALYSAIQQSKVISTINDMQEVAKSIEAYMLDTGIDIPNDTTSFPTHVNVSKLISNTENGWSGPYLPYSVAENWALTYPGGGEIQAIKLKTETWAFPFVTAAHSCSSGVDCYYWVFLSEVNNDVANAMDLYVDGVANRNEGKLRMIYPGNNTSATSTMVLVQGSPLLSK